MLIPRAARPILPQCGNARQGAHRARGGPATRAPRTLPSALEALALALGGAFLAYRLATPDPRLGDDDFQVFYAGAAALAAGESPYVGNFVSPPWFALMLVPLTALPLPAARAVWLALNLALLGASTALAARLVGLHWPARRLALTALLFALWPPAEFGLKLGQNSLAVWALLLLALHAAGRRHWSAAGVWLALSAVKPQLGFLYAAGLAVAAARQGALVRLLTPGAMVLLALAGAAALAAPAGYAALAAGAPRPWNYWGSNVSLPALLGAFVGREPWVFALYAVGAGLGAALVATRWARTPLADTAALTAPATLLLTPYAYPHDAVLLQLPLLWLIAWAARRSWPAPRQAAALGLAGALGVWALERPADYTVWRFLGLLPPLGLLLAVAAAQRAPTRST